MELEETMKIGILKEATETEQRVALVPQIAQLLSKQKVEWMIESGAGISAGFNDSDYADHDIAVAAASGAASVGGRHITSRGWDPWTERPLPEVVRVAYPLMCLRQLYFILDNVVHI